MCGYHNDHIETLVAATKGKTHRDISCMSKISLLNFKQPPLCQLLAVERWCHDIQEDFSTQYFLEALTILKKIFVCGLTPWADIVPVVNFILVMKTMGKKCLAKYWWRNWLFSWWEFCCLNLQWILKLICVRTTTSICCTIIVLVALTDTVLIMLHTAAFPVSFWLSLLFFWHLQDS